MASPVQPVQFLKKKSQSPEELNELSKEELINRIIQLEAHNIQLKNILKKHLIDAGSNASPVYKTRKRPFDFSKHNRRHVLLRLCYLGWDYQGLATQETSINTIEHYLFDALTKCCLVESRQSCNYHRCGRTDKGVSSFCQPISLDLRSCLPQSKIDQGETEGELPYVKMLNRLLPNEIRALSWAPVPADFSARFDCKSRTYKYLFPRGALDICRMNEAAQHLLGTHDFRNFCKLDVKNGVVNYMRNILFADVCVRIADPFGRSAYDLCEVTLQGKAFLWHQVRCILGILVLVGRKLESPDIIKSLLSVEENPCKPQYNMAEDFPLNLFSCEYGEEIDYVEIRDREDLDIIVRTMQNLWSQHSIRAGMVRCMLEDFEKKNVSVSAQADFILQGVTPRIYQPLLKRQKCESLEDRIEHFKKKRKLEVVEDKPGECSSDL